LADESFQAQGEFNSPNTGDAKGKTTAAIGVAFRALAHGMRVGMPQFIKGKWRMGERKLGDNMPNLTLLTMGRGFTWESEDLARDRAAAVAAWETACRWLAGDDFDIVVLDEITYVVKYGFVSIDEVVGALKSRREGLHVILTGRSATAKLTVVADLVTEMRAVKHPYRDGVTETVSRPRRGSSSSGWRGASAEVSYCERYHKSQKLDGDGHGVRCRQERGRYRALQALRSSWRASCSIQIAEHVQQRRRMPRWRGNRAGTGCSG
jgi:cob(I)alamin adenosyltransferase